MRCCWFFQKRCVSSPIFFFGVVSYKRIPRVIPQNVPIQWARSFPVENRRCQSYPPFHWLKTGCFLVFSWKFLKKILEVIVGVFGFKSWKVLQNFKRSSLMNWCRSSTPQLETVKLFFSGLENLTLHWPWPVFSCPKPEDQLFRICCWGYLLNIHGPRDVANVGIPSSTGRGQLDYPNIGGDKIKRQSVWSILSNFPCK